MSEEKSIHEEFSGVTEVKDLGDLMIKKVKELRNAYDNCVSNSDLQTKLDKINDDFDAKIEAQKKAAEETVKKRDEQIEALEKKIIDYRKVNPAATEEEKYKALAGWLSDAAQGKCNSGVSWNCDHGKKINGALRRKSYNGLQYKAFNYTPDILEYGGALVGATVFDEMLIRQKWDSCPFLNHVNVVGRPNLNPYSKRIEIDPTDPEYQKGVTRQGWTYTQGSTFGMITANPVEYRMRFSYLKSLTFFQESVDPEEIINRQSMRTFQIKAGNEHLYGTGQNELAGILVPGLGRNDEVKRYGTGDIENLFADFGTYRSVPGQFPEWVRAGSNMKWYASKSAIFDKLLLYKDAEGTYRIRDDVLPWRMGGMEIVEYTGLSELGVTGGIPLILGDLRSAVTYVEYSPSIYSVVDNDKDDPNQVFISTLKYHTQTMEEPYFLMYFVMDGTPGPLNY